MIKWFVYIVLLLIFVPHLSSANMKTSYHVTFFDHDIKPALFTEKILTDSLTLKKHQQEEEKKKIKEISKAKRQAKPEKIDETNSATDPKTTRPKRERRPEGLERPPEIPRRNGN